MSNLILTGAKSFGQALIRTGGRIAISYANQAIGNAFNNRVTEGPRLETLHIQSSRDGAPMARVFGRARIAGQIIWAARVREHVTEENQGGKGGGPSIRKYKYTLSFAIGLCEGEILGVDKIWANGLALQTNDLNTRLYLGTQTQNPDPLIAEIEGVAVPAFRGTAYMVFEDMPVDEFGARLPQLNFEIIRLPKRTNNDPRLEDLITGINLIPGSGEFAYGTTITEERLGPGTSRPINMNNLAGVADMEVALDQLKTQLPNCTSVSLVVSWFGSDLRADHCEIFPGVESRERTLSPKNWKVNGEDRNSATLISTQDDRPVYGGTPSDASIVGAVQSLKARGYKVSLYPFILMDIPELNSKPNPYGGLSQPAFPWRGRITCNPAPEQTGSVDKTSIAETQVQEFFGTAQTSDFSVTGTEVSYTGPVEKSYRRMILHYAHLMQAIGGIDAFILGSEMRGLTTVRGSGGTYPAVTAFKNLAAYVRSIVGTQTKLTYAADWSEYFGHHPSDGSGDVLFHLDPLWADTNIDVIGIDAYFPLSDWRDQSGHLDESLAANIYDTDYLAANLEGGEGYDWYYANPADRDGQIRTPITDGLANKPWVFRYKDVRNWWGEAHYERVGGQELPSSTAWIAKSKPIWFTEIGCPAIDKGANQPNVFFDPKSSESFVPYYSAGTRDDLIQRRYIEAFLGYWGDPNNNPNSNLYSGSMIDMSYAHIWSWDARPYPDFPARLDVWSDGNNWQTGHWVNGRTGLVGLADIVSELTLATGSPAPDVSLVHGMVSGYVIDRPMSARAAISPLSFLYDFDLTEQAQGLTFSSKNVANPFLIDKLSMVRDNAGSNSQAVLTLTCQDIETRPKDVRLSFIEQGRDYQSGNVTARNLLAETVRIIDMQAPVVLDTAQAKLIAGRLLEQSLTDDVTMTFSVPPSLLAFEPGDILEIGSENGVWQIVDLEGLGTRRVQARQILGSTNPLVSGAQPGVIAAPNWVGSAEGVVLDIANLDNENIRQGPLVGAQLSPWVRTIITAPSGVFAEAIAPVIVGSILNDFPIGPVGRYDYGPSLDIYLQGVTLSSLSDEDVLAGGNLFAVETSKGWEIFQGKNVELTAQHTYRIDTFVRGRFGSDADMDDVVFSGARIIFLNQGFQDIGLNLALRGSHIEFEVVSDGRTETQTLGFDYQGIHLRPLSPVHICAKRVGADVHISWIRRTRIGGDDWASLDVPLGEDSEMFEIDFVGSGQVLSTKTVNIPVLQIPVTELEAIYGTPLGEIKISIFQMSQSYGRGANAKLNFTI